MTSYNSNSLVVTRLNEEHIDGWDGNMDTFEYTSLNENSDPKEVFGNELDALTDDEKAISLFFEDEPNIVEKVHPVKMKLRPPKPGSKVANLTKIIENKLNGRNPLKPPGGVDPLVFATNDVVTACSLYIDDEELARKQSTVELAGNIQGSCLCANNRWPDYAATIYKT